MNNFIRFITSYGLTKSPMVPQHKARYIITYTSVLVFLILTLLLGGCREEDSIIETSYKVADHLMEQLNPAELTEYPVLAASFVNIDNLEKSSTFGRAITEYVASRFVQKGFTVVELKLRNSVYIKEQSGEFMLSREVRNLSTEHDAKALIVGTYSIARDTIYLASRIIDPSDATIIATYDLAIPINENISLMMKGR